MLSLIREFFRQKLLKRTLEKKGHFAARQRHHDEPALIDAADHSRVLTIFMLLMLWVVCILALTLPIIQPIFLRLMEGQQAPQSIFAKNDFSYEDVESTRKLQEEAVANEPVCFSINEADNERIRKEVGNFFGDISSYKSDAPTRNQNDASLKALPPDILLEFRIIADSPEFVNGYLNAVSDVLSRGIISNEERQQYRLSQLIRVLDVDQRNLAPKPIEDIYTPAKAAMQIIEISLANYPAYLKNLPFKDALLGATLNLLGDRGNLHFDTERTNLRRQQAQSRINPVMLEVLKGEPVLRKDTIVDESAKRRLAAYEDNLISSQDRAQLLRKFVTTALRCFLLVLFLAIGVWCIRPDLTKSNRPVALAGMIIVMSIAFNYFIMRSFYFFSANFNLSPSFASDAIPLALGSVVIAVTLGLDAALFSAMFIAGVSTMMLNPEQDVFFQVLLSYITTSTAAALAVRNVSNYRLLAVRTMVATTLGLFILNFPQASVDFAMSNLLQRFWICLCNGFVTAVAALLLIFALEIAFHITTNMSLLLQGDITHPLLKELQLKAPGTSYHCQSVAVLAEAAAKAAGANSLKCRVGALFHDIGKLKKPEYFTENNINTANMHEDLTPAMSAIVLRSHVEDGVELARQYRLSKLIRDMIQQHHGTSLMRFFYNKAMEQANGAQVLISQYSYPGPLPHDKEVVIVSLADSCEAACRSLSRPTLQNITGMVNGIFRERLESGQLDDAQITVAELAKIKESFIRTLTTMYHSRIAYPEKKGEAHEPKQSLEEQKTFQA